jgi:hypothetical protein
MRRQRWVAVFLVTLGAWCSFPPSAGGAGEGDLLRLLEQAEQQFAGVHDYGDRPTPRNHC